MGIRNRKLACSMLVGLFFIVISYSKTIAQNTKLSDEALSSSFYDTEGEHIPLKEILERYPDKTILIDLWASWCKDCIVGFPKLKEIQKKRKNLTVVYLSVDKKDDEWKNGIKKFGLDGNNFRADKGWESEFCESIELDWIPRYMLVDSKGNILHYKSIEARDRSLAKALKASS
ncbi:MAG: thioredoxin family protein [Cyclobacteriaceae bacterium]